MANGREEHLLNLLRGLASGSRRPEEVVLVCMNGWRPPDAVHGFGLRVREVEAGERGGRSPLAAARNAGARAALSDALIFLDVDCIPGPRLVESYLDGLFRSDAVLMGEVRYLPPRAADGFEGSRDYGTLLRRGVPHPRRTVPPPGGPSPTRRYEEFWSLSFATDKEVFLKGIGGFDERFDGYGGEDTDFAFEARRKGVGLAWMDDALAFHQHHRTCDPPLNHLEDIVRNARLFREKWGSWPMEGWLRGFASMALVEWAPGGTDLRLLRLPTGEEVEARTLRDATVPA